MDAILILILIPAALYLMQRFFGDAVPAAIALILGAAAVWVFPDVPGSPAACLDTKAGCTGRGLDWVIGTAFLIPLAAAVAYKALRGDKRGVTGTRRVFRGKRG